jgi:hypothetical protein
MAVSHLRTLSTSLAPLDNPKNFHYLSLALGMQRIRSPSRETSMRSTWIFIAAAAVLTAGCAQRQFEETGDVVLNSRWIATLAPVSVTRDSAAITGATTVTLGGRASMMPSTATETRAMLSLFGATPGAMHAWHIHLGSCGNDRGIIGSPELYTSVSAGNDGRGDVTVTLPFTTPNSGEFYVDIHATQSSASRIVACGPLMAGGG